MLSWCCVVSLIAYIMVWFTSERHYVHLGLYNLAIVFVGAFPPTIETLVDVLRTQHASCLQLLSDATCSGPLVTNAGRKAPIVWKYVLSSCHMHNSHIWTLFCWTVGGPA